MVTSPSATAGRIRHSAISAARTAVSSFFMVDALLCRWFFYVSPPKKGGKARHSTCQAWRLSASQMAEITLGARRVAPLKPSTSGAMSPGW